MATTKKNELRTEFNNSPSADEVNIWLQNFVSKNESVIDDSIDAVSKFVNGKVHLEADYTITDRIIKVKLTVQKVDK